MHTHLWSERKIRRVLMAVDMVSMSAAFVLSYWLRHHDMFASVFGQFYYIALFLILFIYLFLSTYRRVKKREHSLTVMDAVDNLMDLIKGRLEQYVILVILLALSGSFAMLSRRVLAYTIVLDIVFSYAGHMAVRRFLRRAESSIVPSRHYYIVTNKALAPTARERLNEILPVDGVYAGTICVNDAEETDELDESALEENLYTRLEQELSHCFPEMRGRTSENADSKPSGHDISRDKEGQTPYGVSNRRAERDFGQPEGELCLFVFLKERAQHAYMSGSVSENYGPHLSAAGNYDDGNGGEVRPDPTPDKGERSKTLTSDEMTTTSAEITPGSHNMLHQTGVHAGLSGSLTGGRTQAIVDTVVRFGREHAISVMVRQFSDGQELPASMVGSEGRYATTVYQPAVSSGEVLGVRFVPSNVEEAAFTVLNVVTQRGGLKAAPQRGCEGGCPKTLTSDEPVTVSVTVTRKSHNITHQEDAHAELADSLAGRLSGEYICFSNVHTTVMAKEDKTYREILNGAVFTFADGAPIARQLQREGFESCTRVAGPDFMDAVFRATMDGEISHYFYGSTQETIDRLCEELPKRYPGIRIAGAVSPPFRPETPEEDAASVAAINASGAAFVWIGLGAPKQEKWMAAHRGRINGVMLGVGAGFNFYAGTVKRAPKWVQKLGFEWFYRFLQDPKRLANRYIVTNAKYVWYICRRKKRR